jgi:hypothetical protein
MSDHRFFIDYSVWRKQFERDIWQEPYHVQQLSLFMFEVFLTGISRPLAPVMTWELAQKGMGFFYNYLLTDQASLIAARWPSLLFWFGESGYWESELTPRLHLQQIQDYTHRFDDEVKPDQPVEYANHCAIQYALLLMEYGLPSAQLASERAWQMLYHEIHGGMYEEWVNEFYFPPHLIWKGEMFHPYRRAVPESLFLYPAELTSTVGG